MAGRIVVVRVPYEHNSKAVGLYPAIETAVKGGAAGLVAVTQAVGDFPKWEDVNARNGTGPLPVLMVGKRSGEAVIAAAAKGETGTLTLAADTAGVSCERDVWGELEGADPSRRVFVGTPASSFTPSASEHGSGVAIALGLARHYAALPRSQRPETLVFMALGGHEIGWLGLQALLASPRAAWFKEADAYVHLGSALGAPIAEEQPDGTIVTTPKPDPTGRLHDSENPLLERGIIEDFEAAGVPTPETPPHTASGGEQTNAYAAGIPTVSFSGASLFFHTAGDVPSTVDPIDPRRGRRRLPPRRRPHHRDPRRRAEGRKRERGETRLRNRRRQTRPRQPDPGRRRHPRLRRHRRPRRDPGPPLLMGRKLKPGLSFRPINGRG